MSIAAGKINTTGAMDASEDRAMWFVGKRFYLCEVMIGSQVVGTIEHDDEFVAKPDTYLKADELRRIADEMDSMRGVWS